MKLDENLVEYLNFLIEFAKKPREALRPYAGEGRIEKKLTIFMVAGVVISWIIARIAVALGAADKQGAVLSFIRSFEHELWPIVALVIILIVTVIFHLTAKAWISIGLILKNLSPSSKDEQDAYLGGSLQDSINASLAFAAFIIPVATISLSFAILFIQWNPAITLAVTFVLGLLLAILIIMYYVSALSATHPNTSFLQAFLAFGGAIVVINLARYVIEYLSRLI